MKEGKEDFLHNRAVLDNEFKRGVSFTVIDGKNFTKAESPHIAVIQPISPHQSNQNPGSATSSNAQTGKPDK